MLPALGSSGAGVQVASGTVGFFSQSGKEGSQVTDLESYSHEDIKNLGVQAPL